MTITGTISNVDVCYQTKLLLCCGSVTVSSGFRRQYFTLRTYTISLLISSKLSKGVGDPRSEKGN